MNSLQRVGWACETIGLRFRVVGDAVLVQFGEPAMNVVLRAREFAVTLERPCGVILRSALADAIREVNRLNSEVLPLGAFWVRERDRLLSFTLPLLAPTGVTPEQLDIGLAAVVLNPYPPQFDRFLEAPTGLVELEYDEWWDAAS
jgi:hypothetical protein